MDTSSADSDLDTLTARSTARVGSGGHLGGSGYFLYPNLLLSVSYAFLDSKGEPLPDVTIRTLDGETFTDYEVVWSPKKPDLKIALVRVNGRETGVPDLNFARLIRPGTRNCSIVALTKRSRDDDSLIARRLPGAVDPGAYMGSTDILEFALAKVPEWWRGLGGAPVFFGQYLIGIVFEGDQAESALTVRPIARLLDEASFRSCLKREIGYETNLIDLSFTEPTIMDALKDVSKADPSNIQEVAAAQFLLSNSYYENVLAQARRSFNAAVVAAAAGLVFFLVAIVFAVIGGKLTAPLVSALAGGVVEVVAGLNFWLYGRTAVQLNSFHKRLERMQRFLVANSVSASLTGENREAALIDLIKVISAGAAEPSSRVGD